MRIKPLIIMLAATASLANAYDFSALQQLLAAPALQGQAATPAPNLAMGMLGNLTPSQTEVLTQRIAALADKTFTPAEKAKLTEFQSSPEGASIIGKLPGLAQQIAPVLMEIYLSPAGTMAPAAPAPKK